MPAPQSGQTRLRIAEIKVMLLFLTTANEAIMSLPIAVVLHHRMHRTLSAGPQERNWGGRSLERSAALASDSDVRATESPNDLLSA